MSMDERKRRILMTIVSLYALDGEPVGSNLLSKHFDMEVSSATLRNEMALLTKLGLLEQPHTSAGRVPTAKGYRFYVEDLLNTPLSLEKSVKEEIDLLFSGLDYDPEKLAQGAAKAFSSYLGYAVLATTPLAKDTSIAHFEVIQVGRYTAAILAVTAAGGVLTRVAKVDFEFREGDTQRYASCLNRFLRFVAEPDVTPSLIRNMVDSLGINGHAAWPILSAGLALLAQAGRPSIYFEGHQHLLQWPELEPGLRSLLELVSDRERVEELLDVHDNHTAILFGDELPENPIHGLCMISRPYLAGSGLQGVISVAGPIRMKYGDVISKLEYFSHLLGQYMSGHNHPGTILPNRNPG